VRSQVLPLGSLPSIPTLSSDCQSFLVIPELHPPPQQEPLFDGNPDPDFRDRVAYILKQVRYRGIPGDFTSWLKTSDAQGLQGFPRAPRKSVHAYNELYARNYTAPHEMSTGGPPFLSYGLSQFCNIAECDCGSVAVEISPGEACNPRMIKADCPICGTSVVKLIYCGKEWCPVCGRDWSTSHQRRFSRLLPKAMQMSEMGYFVIEFPDRFRKILGYAYSARALRLAGNAIVDVLAGRHSNGGPRSGGYFRRGWWRWHWFGDRQAGKWNPHANVIVDAGHLPGDVLEAIKVDLRRELKCADLIVNYHYRRTEGEMVHTLKYVTRSTFSKEQWDPYMARQLYGFINVHRWGKWDGPAVWKDREGAAPYLAIEKLERGLCPDCGCDLKWGKKTLPGWVFESNLRSGWLFPLGGGYFKLKVPKDLRECQVKFIKERS
jgi:hypothetical protein